MIVIKVCPILFVFAAIILAVHLAFLLTAGKIFKLDLAEIVIASNANMGGPTTAAAMAVARKWQPLVISGDPVRDIGLCGCDIYWRGDWPLAAVTRSKGKLNVWQRNYCDACNPGGGCGAGGMMYQR